MSESPGPSAQDSSTNWHSNVTVEIFMLHNGASIEAEVWKDTTAKELIDAIRRKFDLGDIELTIAIKRDGRRITLTEYQTISDLAEASSKLKLYCSPSYTAG